MEILFSFTPQLYFFPKFRKDVDLQTLKPEPIASGILVNIQNRPFLITAKHIFDYQNATMIDIAIMKSNGFISLDGFVAFRQCTKEHDSIDIAIIELPLDRAKAISEVYQFLPWQNMNFNHVINAIDTYFFGGYINYQTKRKGKEYTITPFGFQTKIKTDIRIDRLGFDLNVNIPLRYNKRKQRRENENHQSKGPKEMQGLSGCGIWHIERNDIAQTNTISLVGILIEGILEKGILFGTHIRLVQALLKDYFDISLP